MVVVMAGLITLSSGNIGVNYNNGGRSNDNNVGGSCGYGGGGGDSCDYGSGGSGGDGGDGGLWQCGWWQQG